MMSLVMAVPKGIKDRESKRFALQECPPVPYVPEKDPVQETVSFLKSDHSLKTAIRVDAELHLPIWHCGMCEAFLMHVSSALDAIKRRGTFKACKEAHEAYVEQRVVAKQAKAALALLTAPTSKGKKDSEKASGKESAKKSSKKEKASEKEPVKKSSEKEKTSKKIEEGTASANAPALELCNKYQAFYDKAIFAKETAKRCRCLQDVSVLRKLAVFGCQVLVEQDSPGTDGG
jgi:hypothetical protein